MVRAGVTSSFRYPGVRILLLAGCLLIIGVAATRIVDLPIADSSVTLGLHRG